MARACLRFTSSSLRFLCGSDERRGGEGRPALSPALILTGGSKYSGMDGGVRQPFLTAFVSDRGMLQRKNISC